MKVRPEIIQAVLYGKNQRPAYYKHGQPYFPTISICMVCHGVKDCSRVLLDSGKGIQPTEDEAFMLALIEHGTYVEKWAGTNCGNANLWPEKCTCSCNHEFEEVSRPPTPQSGEHYAKCRKCGVLVGYDTSD